MFLGKSYEEIKQDAHSFHKVKNPKEKKFSGFCEEMQRAILWKHGAGVKDIPAYKTFKFSATKFLIDKTTGRWFPDLKKNNLKKLVGKKKALISLPSLNFPNKDHMVFWDGKKLHDPSNLKRYTAKNVFTKAKWATVAA